MHNIKLIVIWLIFISVLIGAALMGLNKSCPSYEECDCNNMVTDLCITMCTGDIEPANPVGDLEDFHNQIY